MSIPSAASCLQFHLFDLFVSYQFQNVFAVDTTSDLLGIGKTNEVANGLISFQDDWQVWEANMSKYTMYLLN